MITDAAMSRAPPFLHARELTWRRCPELVGMKTEKGGLYTVYQEKPGIVVEKR
jgi:hypothetical protein